MVVFRIMISKSWLCKQDAAGLSMGRTRVHAWRAGLGAVDNREAE